MKAAGHRIGKNQLYDWLDASQDCYLCFTLRRLKAAATERELGEKKVYFYRGRGECDFVVREGGRAVGVVQVCRSLADPKTRTRELRGPVECCTACGLGAGTIITAEETEQFTEDGVVVRVVPLWRWLLEG